MARNTIHASGRQKDGVSRRDSNSVRHKKAGREKVK